jgi:bifunctional DNase/RNase
VRLCYFEGLTQAEAAARLGIEVGAVKTRLHKARAALRRRLGATWQEEALNQRMDRRRLTKAAGAMAGAAAVQRLGAEPAAAEGGLVAMRLRDVFRRRAEDGTVAHVALLEETGGERVLPIWMGEFEATALALRLEGVQPPRPLAYGLMAGLLAATGGTLREVRISRLADRVFYAEVVIEGPEGSRAVDARPSDALNLALLAGAPILVEPGVLAACASPAMEWQDGAVEGAAAIVADWTAATARALRPEPAAGA